MDPDYLPFHPAPKRPDLRLPPGAVDAHCHVFGPAARFPFASTRKYTPCDAPAQSLFDLHQHLGLSRCVIVQASCHGTDNSALLDALGQAKGTARGVTSVAPTVSDGALATLHDAGVRGLRFNFLKRLGTPPPKESLLHMAQRLQPLGWHLVVYCEAEDLTDLSGLLKSLPLPVVLDHMARPDVRADPEGPAFQQLVTLMEAKPDLWVKISCPERLSQQGPPYSDVVPFARLLMSRFRDRLLWGTDWPHPNMKSHMPDDGALVDWLAQVAPTEAERQALLIDNPMRLYWPEEV